MAEQKRQRGRPYLPIVLQDVLLRDRRFSAATRRALIRQWKLDADKHRKLVEKYAIILMMEHVAGCWTGDIPVELALGHLVDLRDFIIWLGQNYVFRPQCSPSILKSGNGIFHVPFQQINSAAWATHFGMADIGQFHRLCNALADKLRITTSYTHVPHGRTTARFDECFLVFLAFAHQPSRLRDVAVRVGTAWDDGKISNIINGFAQKMADTFGTLIKFDHRFFTSRVWVQKAMDAFAQKGSQVDGVFGLIDGTDQPIARPLGHYQQMAHYSGKDKVGLSLSLCWLLMFVAVPRTAVPGCGFAQRADSFVRGSL